MDAITMLKKNLPSILTISEDFPTINFKADDEFYWSAQINTVFYVENELNKKSGIYRLFHEIGHALSNHQTFSSGIQLIKLESEAWLKAKEIAERYNLNISDDQIEKCLDSYRDWLHLRSICPECSIVGVEANPSQYRCFNCLQNWKVPVNQRSRNYRLKQVK